MVALAVPRFGMVLEVNLARTFLHRAHDALQAGKLFEAGVLLREAVRRQLVAECNWYGCLPKDFTDRTSPLRLLKMLQSAGHCSPLPSDCRCKFHRIRRSVASHAEAAGANATAMLRHTKREITESYLDPTICTPQQPVDVLFRLTEPATA